MKILNRVLSVSFNTFFVVFFVLTHEKLDAKELRATDLLCEYRVNPLGIDSLRPRLSWALQSQKRRQSQTAFQVLVSEERDQLNADPNVLWNSGKVISNQSIQIVYQGPSLKSQQKYYWKIRVWDGNGQVSSWSEVSNWETAFLDGKDWKAKWISDGRANPQQDEDFYKIDSGPLFRTELQIEKSIEKARLYVSGIGLYEARINGRRVGNQLLDPAWTTYSKRILYSTYDVTDQLRSGKNCLGIMLGNGWYNVLPMRMWGQLNLRSYLTSGRPQLIAQLAIEYADGSKQIVVTDNSWKAGEGPILKNDFYLGELYDARKEQEGWDKPGFDDSNWSNAAIADTSLGTLEAQSLPPIKQTALIKPVKVTHLEDGAAIFDFGQNFSGWVRLQVKGPAGTQVKLRYGELLNSDGSLNVMTTVCGQIKEPGKGGPGAPALAQQSDTYILKGGGNEVYTPRFTYHGFRYVEVSGFPGKPDFDAIEGLRLNTEVEKTGTFSCSNELFNRIQKMAEQTFPNNLMGVQTDCPGRERFAYGDDIACAAEAHLYNYDMATFYAKTVRDFADAARTSGALTLLAPWTGHSIGGFDAGGGSFADRNGGDEVGSGAMSGVLSHPLLLDLLYTHYGDLRLLEEQYETARRSLEFIQSRTDGYLVNVGLGDWSSVEPTTTSLLSTAFYYHHAILVARQAEILGHTKDAKRYSLLGQEIKNAFIQKFLKPSTGMFDVHTQAAQAFALYYDLVPLEERSAAIEVLLDDILIKHKGHLSTGIFGTKYLLEVLTRIGRADVAYQIVNQESYPGWGFMLKNDASTMWEVWHFSDNTYSHNHSMFGTVSAWFFSALAGIKPNPSAQGFDRIVIQPQVVGDLTWVNSNYNTIRGKVVSNWSVKQNTLRLEVSIPPNTSATVFVPAIDEASVTERGQPADQADGVAFLRMEADAAVYRIDSGNYVFSATIR